MSTDSKRERLYALDIIRIMSVLFIFLFHSEIHMKCYYGVMNTFINGSAIFMTSFFILSGFLLSHTNYGKNGFRDIQSICLFYKKRLINIMPMYWFIVITYPIYDVFVNGNSTGINLLLLPIEILGLQSLFHSIFGYTHNGGTWFLSCLLLCYMLFPYFYDIISAMKCRIKVLFGIVLGGILLYSPLLAAYLGVEWLYDNAFFRMLEFTIGMILYSLWIEIREKKKYRGFIANWYVVSICCLVLVIGESILIRALAQYHPVLIGNYMVYSWIALPCFSLMIFASAGIESKYLKHSSLIKYLVDISYAFFGAQLYTWDLVKILVQRVGKKSNLLQISLSFVICTMIAVIIHEIIEKPVKRFLSR